MNGGAVSNGSDDQFLVIAGAGHAGGDGPGIAKVSTGGYPGWRLGRAVIGGLGEWFSLPVEMWTIPALAITAGLMAPSGIRAPLVKSHAR